MCLAAFVAVAWFLVKGPDAFDNEHRKSVSTVLFVAPEDHRETDDHEVDSDIDSELDSIEKTLSELDSQIATDLGEDLDGRVEMLP